MLDVILMSIRTYRNVMQHPINHAPMEFVIATWGVLSRSVARTETAPSIDANIVLRGQARLK